MHVLISQHICSAKKGTKSKATGVFEINKYDVFCNI